MDFPFQRLDVYRVALEFARGVNGAGIRDRVLRDQADRAAKSAFLQLCEGLPNRGTGLRKKAFDEAEGSLHETIGALDLACAVGALRKERHAELQALGYRFRGLLMGLRR